MKRGLHPYHGEMLTVGEISERSGVSKTVLYDRRIRTGCSIEEAADMGGLEKRLYHGERMSLSMIAMRSGTSLNVMCKRMRILGMSAEEAADYRPTGETGMPKAVVRIATGIVANPNLREVGCGVYSFLTDAYDWCIRFTEVDIAELTAVYRLTGRLSMKRVYCVKGDGKVRETAAQSR